ncbi:sigma-70 family RNA polymerase sigma factor [Nocardioides hwasunensis]|uniref:Sigma-70 family RNA polymerase sigma factor n=1 Tax=Nocardioides hwasunensis TaxID=397258 RepID=A0ABR8MFC4_9ACTN|nr:sigma-70 family RNA polymerase sigma factor [Nocardioides hwasunensis]MBD3914780.1 sigma-70 family RNA polymerase sigma factor [Nocardioides hwasunensis]
MATLTIVPQDRDQQVADRTRSASDGRAQQTVALVATLRESQDTVPDLQARIRAVETSLRASLGRSPRPSELAEHLHVPLPEVVEALGAHGCFRTSVIDGIVGDGSTTVADLLGWDDGELASLEARLVLGTVLSRLSERDRRILSRRHVDERTQRELADGVGLTQAQVSRILHGILHRLRRELAGPTPAA